MAKKPIPQINVPIMKENGSMELAWYLYLSRLTAGGVGNVISVNGKEGEVVLDAEDVGALPDTTVIPTVYNGTLTVQKNGTAIGTFSANQNENATINVVVPTKTSDLTNDSGFITGISYQMVISALGYTPYDSTNPNGYQANVIETVKVNGVALTVTSKAVDVPVPTKVSDLTNDSGFITGITYNMVTTALGYTPYNATNPNGYQANVIETIKVNGTALTPTDKAVDIVIPDVSIDNSTITRNGSNQLQANAVVNQNSGIVKTWKGTLAQYNALGTHATDTVYIITDDGSDGVIVPGLIMPYAGTTVPPGYLLCDGSAISRTTYANLFAAIGTTYGAGDGNTTFNLPNLFVRSIWYRSDVPLGHIDSGSLPALTGKFGIADNVITNNGSGTGGNTTPKLTNSDGVFTTLNRTNANTVIIDSPSRVVQGNWAGFIDFNAVNKSAAYNRNDQWVVPRHIVMYYIIKY